MPGSVLALFTDGVTEAHRPTDPDSDGGVSAILEASLASGADAIAQCIFESARQEADLRDDLAVVVIRRTP